MAFPPNMLEIIIGNNQEAVEIPEAWLTAFESISQQAADLALEHAAQEESPLFHLATIEVAIVDDVTSDQVHRQFMDIEGATDVITFHHGEILVSADTAIRQGAEHHQPLNAELALYMIHGLMHLGGWDDHEPEEAAEMTRRQEAIWKTCLIP